MSRQRKSLLLSALVVVALLALLSLLLAFSCTTAKQAAELDPAPAASQPVVHAVPPPPPSAKVAPLSALGYIGGGDAAAFIPGVEGGLAPGMNTEEYGRIGENPFLETVRNPLSTFSIDVDRASYSNVRRLLAENQRPPRDAVRIEEMVNYFSYDYPDPSADAPFSLTTEIASCPWNEKNRLLLIGLQGQRIDTADLPPGNLVFLIDVSGSMMDPNKLPLVKSAMHLLVDQLRPQDRVAIVAYAGSAGLVLPSTDGGEKGSIHDAIEQLEAGGSTAGGEGIVLAYKVARESFVEGGNNRVILATDGDFNVGVSSDGELERLIEEKRRSRIFLSVLGFGTGNIKDSKMELLADKGNGNYAYIDTIQEARKVFVRELGATLTTIAKDVKLQIELNPAKVRAYRLIGYENRLLRDEDFHDDAKDAGEMGAGHSVTALYELVPPGSDQALPAVDPLKYQKAPVPDAASASPELLTLKLRYKDPDAERSRLLTQPVLDATTPIAAASENLRFAAAVAELGLLLRESPHKGEASYDQVAEMASHALGGDPDGDRAGFLQMVHAASRLAAR
jgi:Ca-activated chloride channel family protein